MKKILLFMFLLIGMFSLSACGEDEVVDPMQEFNDAVDATNNLTSYKMTISSVALEQEVTIVQYYDNGKVHNVFSETVLYEQFEQFAYLEDDVFHIIGQERSDRPYMVIETVGINEMDNSLQSYDVFKEGSWEEEDGYYITEDVDFEVDGFEDVNIEKIQVKIEDGVMTEIIMTMKSYGIEVIVNVVIEGIDQISVTLPGYFEEDEYNEIMDALLHTGCDPVFRGESFNIAFPTINGYGTYVDYSVGDTVIELPGFDEEISYNITDDSFDVDGVIFTYESFFASEYAKLSKEAFDTIKLAIEIYER